MHLKHSTLLLTTVSTIRLFRIDFLEIKSLTFVVNKSLSKKKKDRKKKEKKVPSYH